MFLFTIIICQVSEFLGPPGGDASLRIPRLPLEFTRHAKKIKISNTSEDLPDSSVHDIGVLYSFTLESQVGGLPVVCTLHALENWYSNVLFTTHNKIK